MKEKLRSVVISMLLLLAVPAASYGQAMWLVIIFGDKAATENFHFNIEGGLVLSDISNLNGKTFLGATFGMGNFIRINDRWAFVPEFKPLALRGEKGIERFIEIPPELEDAESFESKIVLNYIDIPLVFRYELSEKFFVASGPQFSMRTSAKLVTNAVLSGGTTEVEIKNDLRDETEWYDISWPVELGAHFGKDKPNGGMDIKVRWTPGFVDIAREPIIGSKLRTNTFQFLVSFPFLKKEKPEIE